jgi:hypothetical protein
MRILAYIPIRTAIVHNFGHPWWLQRRIVHPFTNFFRRNGCVLRKLSQKGFGDNNFVPTLAFCHERKTLFALQKSKSIFCIE